MRYNGPAYAIMEGVCVQTLNREQIKDPAQAYLFEGQACEKFGEAEASQYWKPKECFDDNLLRPKSRWGTTKFTSSVPDEKSHEQT